MNVNASIFEWIENNKVILYQRYNSSHKVHEIQVFVLVIQTMWMRKLTINITPNSAWAIDYVFKANQYGLPLYAVMCSNTRFLGMPIFLMLCSTDVDKGHGAMTLRLTLKVVFQKMNQVRPNTMIMDNFFLNIMLSNISEIVTRHVGRIVKLTKSKSNFICFFVGSMSKNMDRLSNFKSD